MNCSAALYSLPMTTLHFSPLALSLLGSTDAVVESVLSIWKGIRKSKSLAYEISAIQHPAHADSPPILAGFGLY